MSSAQASRACFARITIIAGSAVILAAVIAGPARAQVCERPVCAGGETFHDGNCFSGPAPFTLARSHYAARCREGETLDRGRGVCVFGGACCDERPLCGGGERFARSGRDRKGTYGVCQSGSPPGYVSHSIVYCAAGWTLDTGRGVCRGNCRVTATPAPGGIVAKAPTFRPDLTFRDAFIRATSTGPRTDTIRRGRQYYVCYTVANIGGALSGSFRVAGGGLGIPTLPFQNHPGLAAGATRNGCLVYPTTPPPGDYTLGIKVDSANVVTEMREDNNTQNLKIRIAP